MDDVYALTTSLHSTRRVVRQQNQHKRPVYVYPESPISTAPTSPERPSKKQCLALNDITNTGANRQRRPGGGRKKKTAADARAINTIRQDVGNTIRGDVATTAGETVVLGRLPHRLFQAGQNNSHFHGHSAIQRDSTLVNPGIQVVMSQREPLPGSTFEELPRPTSLEFIDIDIIAPDPRPVYDQRTLRRHARQERTNKERAPDQINSRRGPYRPRNGPIYYLCRDPDAAKAVELFTVHQGFRDESNTCPYCSAQSWPKERGNNSRWQCCDNGKNDWTPPDQSIKPEDIDGLPNRPEKERERCTRDINILLYEMDEIHVAGQPIIFRRTARSKEFMENIVSYNNCLSFTSEGTDKVDFNVGRTTFRI